jgi:hypothetical protein
LGEYLIYTSRIFHVIEPIALSLNGNNPFDRGAAGQQSFPVHLLAPGLGVTVHTSQCDQVGTGTQHPRGLYAGSAAMSPFIPARQSLASIAPDRMVHLL